MDGFAVYLLKMLTCSGILYGYYRLALYNERFHQWNRFYIIAAFILSIGVPFISLPIIAGTTQGNVTKVISQLPWNSINAANQNQVTIQQVATIIIGLVSLVLIIKLIWGIIHILLLHNKGLIRYQNKVQIIVTSDKNAPFSFFNWLFWREDIDPKSANGHRILQHELAHIINHHSIDKVFTSALLAIFWMNPFFWLLRKELYIIHEFVADLKAINNHDGSAFAQMILQAFPLQIHKTNPLINPFFSSNIKRRLVMITTSTLATYSYARRVSGLAIMIVSIFFVSLSVHKAGAQTIVKKTTIKKNANTSIKSKKRPVDSKQVTIKEVSKDKTDKKEVIEKIERSEKIEIEENDEELFNTAPDKAPLYIVDGKETDATSMKNFDQKLITTVDVMKGQKAIDTYGEKAKYGVVKISTTKSGNSGPAEKVIIKIDKPGKPLIYVDGKQITQEEMNLLKPNDIESVNVLKGDGAIKKYGNKGSEGVIEIVMKKN